MIWWYQFFWNPVYVDVYVPVWYVRTVGTRVPYYNVMSQGNHVCFDRKREKGTHVHREPRVFWEDTRQPVERGSECRAAHTYTLALTPLPQRRGLPRVRNEMLQARYHGTYTGRCTNGTMVQ